MDTTEILKKQPCIIRLWPKESDKVGRQSLPPKELRIIGDTIFSLREIRIFFLEDPKWNDETQAEVAFLTPLEKDKQFFYMNLLEGPRIIGLLRLSNVK